MTQIRKISQIEPIVKKKWAKTVYQTIVDGNLGPYTITAEFERKISELTGAKYVHATTSGTSAIMLALYGLDIPLDKLILFPNYGFLAGANVAKIMGYDVKLIDINTETLCMDSNSLIDTIHEYDKENIGCVIYIDFNSYTGGASEIKTICDNFGILMLEDSAQAIGVPNAGIIGDVGIFSFSVPKLITTGQGGVMFTNNKYIYDRAEQLKDQGGNWRKTKRHEYIGINLKFDDIHASYGLAQLNDLDWIIKQKKRIFYQYKKNLGSSNFYHSDTDLPWMIILKTPIPDKIIAGLKLNGVQAVKYYNPVHQNASYASNDYTDHMFKNTIYTVNNSVYLPSSLTLTNKEINYICNIIKQIMI